MNCTFSKNPFRNYLFISPKVKTLQVGKEDYCCLFLYYSNPVTVIFGLTYKWTILNSNWDQKSNNPYDSFEYDVINENVYDLYFLYI